MPPVLFDSQRYSSVSPISRQSHWLKKFKAAAIERALQATSGNVTEAAAILGINRRTLHRKLKDMVPAVEENPCLPMPAVEFFSSPMSLQSLDSYLGTVLFKKP